MAKLLDTIKLLLNKQYRKQGSKAQWSMYRRLHYLIPDTIDTAPEQVQEAKQQDTKEHAEEAPPTEHNQLSIQLL